MTTKDPQDVVFGSLGDAGSFVFIPLAYAVENAGTWRALSHSKTYGDLRAALKVVSEEAFENMFSEEDVPLEDQMPDSEPFDFDSGDGLWPTQPTLHMQEWMPDAALAMASTFDGDGRVWFSETELAAVVALLTERGYRCTRDDALVREACGEAMY